MSGLFHTLNVGSHSLFASRQGLDTTAHNIANAQTEGFSRQRVNLSQRDPTEKQGHLIGNGVYTGSIKRSHNKFIEQQMNTANSFLGEGESRQTSMLSLEAIFSPELGSTISQEMSRFFDSLQSLSNYPEEVTVRTAVKERGVNLASSFRRVDGELRGFRAGVNEEIKSFSSTLNDIVKNIAVLNDQIRQAENGPDVSANDLRDKRDQLLRSLTEKVDVRYYEDAGGMVTVRGPGEVLLVDRGKSASFITEPNGENNGLADIIVVDFEGSTQKNITNKLKSGSLSSLVDVRDRISKSYMEKNNELAYTFANRFNEVHKEGFGLKDYSRSNGRNFFSEIGSIDGAAQNIKVDSSILNSVEAISASSTANTVGDNINVNTLLAIKSEKIFDKGGSTINEYYSNFVGNVGVESQRSQNLRDSASILMADLKSRSDAVSGVSLDEEASNMLRWQTAFTASSRVITTVDEMLETILNLKR